MATVTQTLDVAAARIFTTVQPPERVQDNGTNYPLLSLAFDQSTQEACFFEVFAANYGSGNVSILVDWITSATSGNCIWGAQLSVTTAGDNQSLLTDAFATAATVTTAANSTANGHQRSTIAISSLDSLAAGDRCALKLYRDAANGSDTLAADAKVFGVQVQWSDV